MELPAMAFFFFIFIVGLHADVTVMVIDCAKDQKHPACVKEQRNNSSSAVHVSHPLTKTKTIKQCYKRVNNCLLSSPFQRNECLKKLKKCSSYFCSAKKCFHNARKCTIESRTPQEMFICIKNLKTCVKRKKDAVINSLFNNLNICQYCICN